jgi:hypothetical protein
MYKLKPYPHMYAIDECPAIHGMFCYIIKIYEPGSSIIIAMSDQPTVVIGDWAGNIAQGDCDKILASVVPNLMAMMKHISLRKAQFFIDSTNALVDVQLSDDRFMGPGMLRDLFSPIMATQAVDSIAVIDQPKVKSLCGSSWILKPSRYRNHERGGIVLPLYARI